MATDESKGKVLIMDDDVDFRDVAESVLAGAGYQVATAGSGEEGLAIIGGLRPDVVILDLMLEHPDAGFSVAHQIRKTPGLEGVPIILVTSAARDTGFRFDLNSEDARRWIKVDRLLNKPVTSAELLANVADALRQPAAQ